MKHDDAKEEQPASSTSRQLSTAGLNKQHLDLPSPRRGGSKWPYGEDESDDGNASDCYLPPSGQRLAPVGAAQDQDEVDGGGAGKKMPAAEAGDGDAASSSLLMSPGHDEGLKRKLREMEDEQEELNASLMAMTSHFAKVRHSYDI